MANVCLFTGMELPEGSTTLLKKMCLNCKSLVAGDNGTYACANETVMEQGRAKILAAVPDGFEIDSLVLKPMNLKNPTKKCGNYEADIDMLTHELTKELQ